MTGNISPIIFQEILNYPLSLGLNISDARNPNITAALSPAAADFIPPVNIPINPALSISFITPLTILYPKPRIGTVAPAPPNAFRAGY